MKRIFVSIIFVLFALNIKVFASDTIYNYDSTYSEEYENSFCAPDKESLLSKLKNVFIGRPSGFTPPVIEPSPYINTYGPSYMRGYYGTNGWNSHNSFNPVYSGSRINILN